MDKETITAKAGENIVPKLTSCKVLSHVIIYTKEPAGVTITTSGGSEHRVTKKNENGSIITEKFGTCFTPSGEHGTITSIVFDDDTEAVIKFEA